MLKALELAGFKSFADKTRFEFPPGITVVVGPNGSGKSNIVDAIKWVLGEQSAKSLRGKDMADVIFKGGGSGRRVMNTAEATIVFDNSEGRLPVDAPEVHVTRRVYRSGEGEYLINRQPCRLRDIRDMFRGTGVGTDAYSLIEQGKVDRMLQASSKDRRFIFEEAAGISRFKAKKVEAQRRLERVETNLVRLADIVDEVESRLRSIRSQASKARRYREYSDRLQQLRTQVGWSDWRRLTQQLEEAEGELRAIERESASLAAESQQAETQIEQLEIDLNRKSDGTRETESRLGRLREMIAEAETENRHRRSSCQEWEQQASSARSRLLATALRASDLEQRLAERRSQMADAQVRHDEAADVVANQEAIVSELTDQAQQLRDKIKRERQVFLEHVREATMLTSQLQNLQRQVAEESRVVAQTTSRIEQWDSERQELDGQLRVAEGSLQKLRDQLDENREVVEATEQDLSETRQILDRRQKEISIYRGRLSGKQERAALLAELEQRRDGVGRGTREILELAEKGDAKLADVCGMVADLVNAKVESAPMVDALLGAASQYLVLASDEPLRHFSSGAFRVPGRVGMVALSHSFGNVAGEVRDDIHDQFGVLQPAIQLIECDEKYRELIAHLLGQAWVVKSLRDAIRLRADGLRVRMVTLAAEVVEPNGTVIVGTEVASDGLISRRSELHALAQEIGVIERQIEHEERELDRLQENVDRQQRRIRHLSEQQRQLSSEHAEQGVVVNTLAQTRKQLQQQIETASRDHTSAATRLGRAEDEIRESKTRLLQLDQLQKQHESEAEGDETRLRGVDEQRQKENHSATSARVAYGRCQEELTSLQAQVRQFEEDQRERHRALSEVNEQLEEAQQRILATERAILRTTSDLALQYLEKDRMAEEIATMILDRRVIESQRRELQTSRDSIQRRLRKLENKHHSQELAAGQVRHERKTLAERLRDDYGIDIEAHRVAEDEDEMQQRDEIDEEIQSLRRKITNIGAVNMEALHELDELDERFNKLSGQYLDLTQAKEALLRIIQRINADSRRLFLETLEAIRSNFQVLYRHAFGGGNADLVLEEGVDPLEAGVEIIATPPGKPSFNNSLLSGGEKALTAVSLLMAIFQFRPSPFCVLDEVDAPFDEANIGRFVDVLKGFLGWTKFVIVTHSKKTMTAANTLYGVTMQESGVSKQVSVTFEDVSEDGHISEDAIKRSQDDAA